MAQSEYKVGDKIRVIEMVGEPDYSGRIGIIQSVDSIGQFHGTWGGLAVQPDKDTIELISD